MKNNSKQIRTTVIFGLICGSIFILLNINPKYFFYWPESFNIMIWMFLAGYGILLTRWGGVKIQSILFPLLLLLIFAFWGISIKFFLVLTLGILSWVRSGICFQKSPLKMIGAEFMICYGGFALVLYFDPYTSISWGLGVWMFFLVQSLYFLLFNGLSSFEESAIPLDKFEVAKRDAERILSGHLN